VQLQGVIAPISTPFQENGDVYHEALRQNIVRYSRAGLKGFVVAGSTGEAQLLDRDEKRKLFETVSQAAREAGGGGVLIAGTGAESVRETLGLIHDAADLDYDATLVLTPHYFRGQMSRPETQAAFFRAVADSSPLPVLLYNIPQNTGIDLPLDVVMQLSEHPNIVGIKDSSADLGKIGQLTSASLPDTFNVMVGASTLFHESLCLGARGGILAIANVVPQSMQLIYDRYQAGDVPGSHAVQQQILDVAGVGARYGVQGVKYAMDLQGYFGGQCRLPLLPLNAQQKAEIELLFREVRDERDAPVKAAI
jgi:4-hydroxy-2-oxoglutarate aldolase